MAMIPSIFDINIQSNSRSNFYSSQEFNNLVQARYFKDKLSFLHLNIRSIRNKFDALISYLNSLDHKFSIALTETKINNNDGDNFEIPGYNSTKLVRQNKIGGGIIIFTGDDLNVSYGMTLFLKTILVKLRLYLLK